jgi:oxidase EvaA
VDVAVRLRPDSSPAGEDLADRLAVSAGRRAAGTALLEEWIADRRRRSPFAVARVPFDRLEGWRFAPGSGDLVHRSGRFFSVQGIHVQTDHGPVAEWSQPILDQPDRAILGILAREVDGVLHFLMQAKMEPGNFGTVQISPTVQATPSNYQRAHNGRLAPYVEYFAEPGRARVLVDVLQSEQGSWFRGKRNRNVVMEVAGDVPHHDDFIWLTLGELYALLRLPNVVNMDSRTVLSCLPLPAGEGADGDGFRDALRRSTSRTDDRALCSSLEVASWLTGRKSAYALTTRQVPLRSVAGWTRTEDEIRHATGRYFSIVGVEVTATNREVGHWCQPLLAPRGRGLVAFVVRRIDGVLHLLARADLRPGYRDVVELGPTVQCTPENFAGAPERRPAFLDLVLSGDVTVRYDVPQSEEGGRFHHAVTRHMVVEVGDDFPLGVPADFTWVTLSQLKRLVASSYQVNIEARSLLACLHALSGDGPGAGAGGPR